MDKRIKGLDIKCFRGIPNQLSIDFTNPKGYALSSIIYGENGSGKSSIIDALEFVLQGKIERSDKFRNPLRPSTSNYISKDPQGSSVTVLFEDETQFTREIVVNGSNTDITLLLKYLDMWDLGGNFAAENLKSDEESCNIFPCFYSRAGLYFADC